MGPLRLSALDQTDLEIISASMQDAIIKPQDLRYLKARRKFVLLANRFVWEAVHSGNRQPYQRRRCGLQFARVLEVKSALAQNAPVLSLLSIGFETGDPPSGTIVLTFAAGSTIRLGIECIEAQLDDLGPTWEALHQPIHDLPA